MKIPVTPASVSELDLMKRLDAYANGEETWHQHKTLLSDKEKKASRVMHTRTVLIVEQVFAFIMDRATARELDTFTMHDRVHGRKVAHLMWHILKPERRALLTPPEIAMLVLAAHLHDAGMALSRSEREKRLAPDSDLWDRVETAPAIKENLKHLRETLTNPKLPESKRIRTESELFQAEEALLALDTRERHASRNRYIELVDQIRDYHDKDRTRIPDIEECFSFDGDSFREKLIEICVSHNEGAEALVERDREHFDRSRFPRSFPIGLATADTHLVAAALRLADILDFDRERTPSTIFHYLVPGNLSHGVNISALEWNKHLSISNWEIEHTATVFRGRCNNHIVHHSVVQFGGLIEEEIASTRATFAVGEATSWPFVLPETVKIEIHEDGYHYLPYQFELDDARVYELLMGGAIYDNALVAVRELVQNAVDACSYRDALSKLAEPHFQPDPKNRITIRYEETAEEGEHPQLTVSDTGTGMDSWVIEQWFLKVGRSYYSSSEFSKDRVQLRKYGCDFAPVSEFGIGFLSCFLLADRVDVETAMWEPIRGDTRKRHLQIDGPTRLIRIREDLNVGLRRLRGTRVTLTLVRGGRASSEDRPTPPTWPEVKSYLERVCYSLPYRLNLEYVASGETASEVIDPKPIIASIPARYATSAVQVPVATKEFEGQIAIVPYVAVRVIDQDRLKESAVTITDEGVRGDYSDEHGILLRGGFNIGRVPGLPSGLINAPIISATVKMLWDAAQSRRYSRTNLARTSASDEQAIGGTIEEIWLKYLLDNRAQLPDGFLYGIYRSRRESRRRDLAEHEWLQTYSALALYELARNGWRYSIWEPEKKLDPLPDWESRKASAQILTSMLYGEILELILPRIASKRTMRRFGDLYVMPPVADWRDILAACSDFISKPVRWTRFVFYDGEIANRLHHNWGYSNLFNEKYADRLTTFSEEELDRLVKLFVTLLNDRSERRPSELNEKDSALLDRVIDVAGELEISSVHGIAKLKTFRRGN